MIPSRHGVTIRHAGSTAERIRIQQQYGQWQREYERARPNRENLRLPKTQYDRPDSWRSPVDTIDTDFEEEEPNPLPGLQFEVAELHAEIEEAEAAEEKDDVAQHEASAARNAMHEVERKRHFLELEEVRKQIGLAAERVTDAALRQAADDERHFNMHRPLAEQVQSMNLILSREEAEVEEVEQRLRTQEEHIVAEAFEEDMILRRRMEEINQEIMEADERRAESMAEAAYERCAGKWCTVSSSLLQRRSDEAMRMEEIAYLAAAADDVAEAESLQKHLSKLVEAEVLSHQEVERERACLAQLEEKVGSALSELALIEGEMLNEIPGFTDLSAIEAC